MTFTFDDINGIKKCYHYTSLKACYEIINTNDLWLSDIGYLNDYQEIISCKNRVFRKIGKESQKRLYNKDFFDYYAISFSRRADSLNQWRNYADDNHGVCIEFDLNKDSLIKTLLDRGILRLQHILYDPRNVNNMIEICYQIAKIISNKLNTSNFYEKEKLSDIRWPEGDLFSVFAWRISMYLEMERKLPLTTTPLTQDEVYHRLSQLFYPFVKNKCYSEEEEIRLVYNKLKSHPYNSIQHRISNLNVIVPFVNMQSLLTKSTDENRILPITKIIVGSSLSDKRIVQSLKTFLAHKQLNDIKVVKSNITYAGKQHK